MSLWNIDYAYRALSLTWEDSSIPVQYFVEGHGTQSSHLMYYTRKNNKGSASEALWGLWGSVTGELPILWYERCSCRWNVLILMNTRNTCYGNKNHLQFVYVNQPTTSMLVPRCLAHPCGVAFITAKVTMC